MQITRDAKSKHNPKRQNRFCSWIVRRTHPLARKKSERKPDILFFRIFLTHMRTCRIRYLRVHIPNLFARMTTKSTILEITSMLLKRIDCRCRRRSTRNVRVGYLGGKIAVSLQLLDRNWIASLLHPSSAIPPPPKSQSTILRLKNVSR